MNGKLTLISGGSSTLELPSWRFRCELSYAIDGNLYRINTDPSPTYGDWIEQISAKLKNHGILLQLGA